jgi:hypothetical protein
VAFAARDFEPVNQCALQVDRFLRYPRGEQVPSWPVEDSSRKLSIIEAQIRSVRRGQRQSPPG